MAGLVAMVEEHGESVLRHANPFVSEISRLKEFVLIKEGDLSDWVNAQIQFQNEIYVEIGCYYGKNLIEMSKAVSPTGSVLGLDITYKRVAKSARKLKRENIQNSKVGFFEAFDFFKNTPHFSVNGVCIFFPDPWNKEKQSKHRLFNVEFCSLMYSKMKNNGWLWFKTDHRGYFDLATAALLESGFCGGCVPEQVLPEKLLKADMKSQFEMLFESQNKPTYQMIFQKK